MIIARVQIAFNNYDSASHLSVSLFDTRESMYVTRFSDARAKRKIQPVITGAAFRRDWKNRLEFDKKRIEQDYQDIFFKVLP